MDMTPTKFDARRWQVVALMAIMLLIGYIAGGFAPNATAQQTITKVQLDTTNCRHGVAVRGDAATLIRFLPPGAILVETISGTYEVAGIYYVCD